MDLKSMVDNISVKLQNSMRVLRIKCLLKREKIEAQNIRRAKNCVQDI